MNLDDDFEAQVRLALGENAGRAPTVDLADAALGQARSIRRRRAGVAAGAAVLVTAAIALPVGLQLGSSDHHDATASNRTTPSGLVSVKPVAVAIAGLDRGSDPAVSYIDDATFKAADGQTHDLEPTRGIITDAVALDGGVGVWSQNQHTANVSFSTNGDPSTLPVGTSVTPPAVDQSTHAVAWAVHDADADGNPADGDTIVYATALDGQASTVQTSMQVRQVMGAVHGQVVFNAIDRHKDEVVGVVTMSGGGGDVETPWDTVKTVTAVSPTGTQVAGILADPLPGQQHCSQMIDTENGQPEWGSCNWNPVEFSADGERVIAVDAGTEGLGVNHLAVLDSSSGRVLQQYTTGGVFGRATFEDGDDTIVMVVTVGDQATIVRCDADGSCELAADPAKVPLGDPDSVLQPFQITAN